MKGMVALRKLLALFLAVLLLSGCAAASAETEPTETTAAVITKPVTEPPTTAQPETTRPATDWEIVQTPESSAFTVISYCPEEALLRVQFRESGVWYVYYDFDPEMWDDFKNADSKGRFFNQSIKGFYEYQRLN